MADSPERGSAELERRIQAALATTRGRTLAAQAWTDTEPEGLAASRGVRRLAGGGLVALAMSVVVALLLRGSGVAEWRVPLPRASWDATESILANEATVTGPRRVRLADGTRVQLDVASDLEVHFQPTTRVVSLRRGRALLDVVHDAQRPFSVRAGASTITDVGTRFVVRREGELVTVALLEGHVFLAGGARLVAPADVERLTAWTQGRLVFQRTPLAEALIEVNRYATRRLRLGDPSLATLPVSGTFVAGDGERVAEALAVALPLRIDRHGNGDIVLRPLR